MGLALGVPECAGYLLDLWLNAAMNRPKGVLYDMDAADIALDAGWDGDVDFFVGALVSCGFLELNEDGVYVLHDWAEHQGYAQFAEERREQARNAANARWAKHRAPAGSAVGMPEQCGEHVSALPADAESNAPSPVPSPSPLPDPKDKDICPSVPAAAKSQRGKADFSPEFEAFYAAYPRRVVKKRAWRNWNVCLKGGASPEELTAAGIATDAILGAYTIDALVARERYGAVLGCEPACSTDDGTYGRAGFCTPLVEEALAAAAAEGAPYDYVACCGPEPLMKIVAGMADAAGVFCEVSMERRMACGVGACLVCACDMACLSCVVDTTAGKRRACVDGPVFCASEVVW